MIFEEAEAGIYYDEESMVEGLFFIHWVGL